MSILELYQNILEVRAVAGDNYLGGEDFTDVMERMFLRDHGLEEEKLDRRTLVNIHSQAEKAKLRLSEKRVPTSSASAHQLKDIF